MSGLEIVGVVLGPIPICVIALDGYIKGTEQRRRWKECRYDLISLRRVLTTHHSILENTCRSLLAGDVSNETLERLVRSGNATEWETPATAKALKQKLGTSLQPCLDTLVDVYAEIQKIHRILQISPNGKVCLLYLAPKIASSLSYSQNTEFLFQNIDWRRRLTVPCAFT